MPNNAEILAQLERLAEARANARDGSDRNAATMLLSVSHDTNFGPILAAARRWVKIEEAAKLVEEWMQERKEWLINNERYEAAAEMRDRQHPLWVALKEPE